MADSELSKAKKRRLRQRRLNSPASPAQPKSKQLLGKDIKVQQDGAMPSLQQMDAMPSLQQDQSQSPQSQAPDEVGRIERPTDSSLSPCQIQTKGAQQQEELDQSSLLENSSFFDQKE